MISIDLLIEAASLTGCKGLTELGLVCIGRPSLFYINGLIFFKNCGFPIVYLITISDVWPKLIGWTHPPDVILDRWFPIVLIALLVLPLVIKKDISELKIASLFLFVGVLAFIFFLFIRLLDAIHNRQNDALPHPNSSYYFVNNDDWLMLVSNFPTLHVGFTF